MAALSNLDQNIQPSLQSSNNEKAVASGEENNTPTMQDTTGLEHKSTILNGKQSGAYISPSDAILSPASQKLSSFKQRQIIKDSTGKKPTSRLLFSKTPSSCSGGSDDIGEDGDKAENN
ncbi:hypothetical protein LTR78_006559 [Recurvomyces mirabilis]|uniref:Uncharacterized protein n=1 Tax=Recurvomyces mirabilis TaxID=574656 RepID=A0AAE0WL13_9PEZI|nr:hypothetical protein LTR78_006559 [Recurvomyces mirabilis]KAK5151023.1 hypothetical protein LTS14_009518 [Recurvomyces mirabilis]